MQTTKIIRVPEKRYIQTLIIGRNNAALIVDELQMRKIPVPTNEMRSIYDEVTHSCPDLTYFKDHGTNLPPEPNQDWLESLELAPMYYYRFNKATDLSLQGCSGAFKMLEDPKMVLYINALSLAGIPLDDVELILNAKYNISYDTPDFKVFANYFANYSEWSYTDKELFVSSQIDLEKKKIYKMALGGERSVLIWELGLGTDPNADFDDMLKDMFTDSYYFFKKNMKYNADDAMKFATLATKLSDRMDAIRDKKADTMDLLSELKIKLVNEDTRKDKRVVDLHDMDIEMPEKTTGKILDLDTLMNSDGSVQNVLP